VADNYTLKNCQVIIKTTDRDDINLKFENIEECKVTMDLYDIIDTGEFHRLMLKPNPNVNISFRFSSGKIDVRMPNRFERVCRKFGFIK